MHIEFNASERSSLGVEVELELVDRETRELRSAASEILAELAAGTPDGDHPKAKHELFECTIEIITGICTTVAEARGRPRGDPQRGARPRDGRGLALMCSGTHPFSDWADQQISPDPRYARLVEEMQWLARRLQIFGIHVHVGVRSAREGHRHRQRPDGLHPALPRPLGVQPVLDGPRHGPGVGRTKVFESLPTAGLPYRCEDWAEFEQFMGTLVSASAITAIREVWWDIRPHPDFGTVELRICDGIPTLREIAAVAALSQCLVEWLDSLDRGYTLPRPSDGSSGRTSGGPPATASTPRSSTATPAS